MPSCSINWQLGTLIIGPTPGQSRRHKSRGPGMKIGAKPLGLPGGMFALGIDWCIISILFSTNADQCKNTTKGLEYRGITAKTRTGITCQDWEENFPHNHTFHESNYPNSGLVLNYCRNPDKDPGGPWCFTISESTVWDYCNTKMCDAGMYDG